MGINLYRGPGRAFAQGNPGRPKGSRHKTTILCEKLLASGAEKIIEVVQKAAEAGDMQAARMVLDRIVPPRRDNPVRFKMPKLTSARDAAAVNAAVLEAVANGEITPVEADQIAKVVDSYVRTMEAGALEERIRALEVDAGIAPPEPPHPVVPVTFTDGEDEEEEDPMAAEFRRMREAAAFNRIVEMARRNGK